MKIYTEDQLRMAIDLARPQYYTDKDGNTLYDETYLDDGDTIIKKIDEQSSIKVIDIPYEGDNFKAINIDDINIGDVDIVSEFKANHSRFVRLFMGEQPEFINVKKPDNK